MFTIRECMVNEFVKTYKNHQVVIHQLIFNQQITMIKGENGSGKSTLLKAMASLIKYDGDIQISSSISYMHEHTTLPGDISLRVFFEGLLKLQKERDKKKLEELLTLFQLNEKYDELINALSKGMRTKVNLIQCLLQDSEVYLLDEPFNGLDQKSVKQLFSYMKQQRDKQFVLTSHIFFDTSFIDCEIVYL